MGQFLSLATSIMRQDQAQGYAQVQATAASVLAELKLRPERFGDLRGLTAYPSAAQGGTLLSRITVCLARIGATSSI